jgi:hypothetical protein
MVICEGHVQKRNLIDNLLEEARAFLYLKLVKEEKWD